MHKVINISAMDGLGVVLQLYASQYFTIMSLYFFMFARLQTHTYNWSHLEAAVSVHQQLCCNGRPGWTFKCVKMKKRKCVTMWPDIDHMALF
jgi:hypothetical protein